MHSLNRTMQLLRVDSATVIAKKSFTHTIACKNLKCMVQDIWHKNSISRQILRNPRKKCWELTTLTCGRRRTLSWKGRTAVPGEFEESACVYAWAGRTVTHARTPALNPRRASIVPPTRNQLPPTSERVGCLSQISISISSSYEIRCPTLYLPLSLRWNRAPDGHSRQGTLPGLWKLGFLCVTYSAASTHRRRRLESRSAQSPAALLGLTIKSRLNYNKRKKIIKLQKVICPPMLLTNLIKKNISSILWYWKFGKFFRPKKCKTRLISLGKHTQNLGNFIIPWFNLNWTQQQWRWGDEGRNKERGSKSKPKEWNPKVHK
jgi:hypothetical protein